MLKKITTAVAAMLTNKDEAVAKWRALDADAKAARKAYNDYCVANPLKDTSASGAGSFSPTRLEHELRQIPALEAEEAAEQAAHDAAEALSAAEASEGDALALERDPARLRDELLAIDAEDRALTEQLVRLRERRLARIHGAMKADREHAARRAAAGLPVSPALPPWVPVVLHGEKTYVERLAEPVPVRSRKRQIENAKDNARRMAAALEEQRIAEEAEKQRIEAQRRSRENEIAARQRAVHEEERQRAEAAAAEQRRRNELGDAYLSRRSSGVAQ